MIPVGKAIVCLIWLFWIIVIDNTAVGQDNNSMSIMDHSKMTLAEIEKVKSMVVVRDRIITETRIQSNIWYNLSKSNREGYCYMWN